MNVAQRVKELCDSKNITFAELERAVGLSNGQIRRWDKVSPRSESLQRVADYFNVSMDYLSGRESYEDMKIKQARRNFNDEGETEKFYAIQRKAKKLDEEDQERLLQLMKLTFQELDDEEDDIDDDL